MKCKAGQLSVPTIFGLIVTLMLAFGPEMAVSGPLKRGSTGPTSQPQPPPPPPPKEVKQEETSEYVYRDTRMIRVPILPPFPIF
jgi:hypothetical protein